MRLKFWRRRKLVVFYDGWPTVPPDPDAPTLTISRGEPREHYTMRRQPPPGAWDAPPLVDGGFAYQCTNCLKPVLWQVFGDGSAAATCSTCPYMGAFLGMFDNQEDQ